MGLTLNEAVDKMRGEVGSSITLTVIRGSQDPFDVTLKRAVITVKSVRWELEHEQYRLYPHHQLQRADRQRPARARSPS